MPSKKGSTKVKPYKWIGHISVYFNDEEIAACLSYCDAREWDFSNVVCVISQQEVAIKFSYDLNNDCYRCVLQPKSPYSYLRGYTLGFNHVELSRLIQIAAYVCEVLMENEAVEIPTKPAVQSW